MSYRKDESTERFLIEGASEHHDAICGAIATAVLPLAADPKVRIGRFTMANGPTTTSTIRVEYLEDKWTVFTADLWTSTSMDSMLIVTEHWSYMSGSWFGRHLTLHAWGSGVMQCVGAGLWRTFVGFTAFMILALPALGFFMVTLGLRAEENLQKGMCLLAFTCIGIAYIPYFRRETTADSSREAQRHLVDRVRQCIYSALAELGIPSSAVHHSTK